ncbi:MAG: tetratricopeptide repeat protein [Opitutaceae bacterium]
MSRLSGVICTLAFVLAAAAGEDRSADHPPWTGDWPAAVAAARRQVSVDTDDSGAWLSLGRVLFEQGRPEDLDEALSCLERAVELEPELAAAWFWLGRAGGQAAGGGGVLNRIRLAGKARAAFTRAAELEPDSFQFVYALVQFHLQAPAMVGGDRQKAAALAAGFNPGRPEERALLVAAVRLAGRDFPGPLEQLDQVGPFADRLVAETWLVLAGQLGTALLDRGRWLEAAEVCQRVTGRSPETASGWLGLGRALAGLDHAAEAEAACRQCLALAPDGPLADAANAVLAGLRVEVGE